VEQVKKEEEQEVLKCFYRTVRAVKIERTSGADFSEPRNGFMVDLYNIVFFSFLFYTLCAALKYILRARQRFFFLFIIKGIYGGTQK
jgi:peptidoglycan biosynthesis protein MviN/MurJ (putative lipid II flippase)